MPRLAGKLLIDPCRIDEGKRFLFEAPQGSLALEHQKLGFNQKVATYMKSE